MLEFKNILLDNGIISDIPDIDDNYKYSTAKSFDEYKRKISFDYLKKIKQPETQAVLIINFDKYNIKNYIGPNTFAEMFMAFAHRKKIYIFNNIPDVYFEELIAWDVITFDGDINKLIKMLKDDLLKSEPQLELFNDI
jgi:hypothetical protein